MKTSCFREDILRKKRLLLGMILAKATHTTPCTNEFNITTDSTRINFGTYLVQTIYFPKIVNNYFTTRIPC